MVKLERIPNKKKKTGQDPVPLPEAIDGSKWDIQRTHNRRLSESQLQQGGGGRLTIPLGGTEVDRAIRVHEQVHAAITPRDPAAWDGVDYTVLELCEDFRVHRAMGVEGFEQQLHDLKELAPDLAVDWDRLRIDYENANKQRDKAGRSLKVVPPRAIVAARLIAAYGTGYYESESNAAYLLDNSSRKFALHMIEDLNRINGLISFNQIKIVAETLCEVLGTPGDPINDEEEEKENQLVPQQDLLNGSSSSFIQDLEKFRHDAENGGLPGLGDGAQRNLNWGAMTVTQQPLPDRLSGNMMRGWQKIPDLQGRQLRRVERLAQDGRVFRSKHRKRKRGGSVLIDCSGSMSLSIDQIEAIMLAMPASIIGTYCAKGSFHGHLWVVAKDGKRAKKERIKPPGGQNVIDGPALQWLAKQKEPRYWVSDGLVTEMGATHTQRAVAYCRVVQEIARITRVTSIDALLWKEGWQRAS